MRHIRSILTAWRLAWQALTRVARVVLVLLLLGVGVLIWQAAPDSVPATADVPAATTTEAAPLVTASSVVHTIPVPELDQRDEVRDKVCDRCEEMLCADEMACCPAGCCGCAEGDESFPPGQSPCCALALGDASTRMHSWLAEEGQHASGEVRGAVTDAIASARAGNRPDTQTHLDDAIEDLTGGRGEQACVDSTPCARLWAIAQEVADVPGDLCSH